MKTTETKLLTVQVPLDATKILIGNYPINGKPFITIEYFSGGKPYTFSLGLHEEPYLIGTIHKEQDYYVFSNGFPLDRKDVLDRLKAENGVYFDNPLGEEPKELFKDSCDFEQAEESTLYSCYAEWYNVYSFDLKNWQQAESKVVKNKLVVLGVKS